MSLGEQPGQEYGLALEGTDKSGTTACVSAYTVLRATAIDWGGQSVFERPVWAAPRNRASAPGCDSTGARAQTIIRVFVHGLLHMYLLDRFLHVHRSEKAVLHDVQRNLPTHQSREGEATGERLHYQIPH